jgi:hypothetical protein
MPEPARKAMTPPCKATSSGCSATAQTVRPHIVQLHCQNKTTGREENLSEFAKLFWRIDCGS